MSAPFSSVSVVIVVRDAPPSGALLTKLSEALEALFTEFEFVIVANDIDAAASLQIKALVETLPDSLAVFLGDRVPDDIARLVGIDHAVSDHVLFCTPSAAEIATLPSFADPLRDGCDLVIGRSPPESRSLPGRLLFSAFQALFRLTTGKTFEDSRGAFRIMSRPAALYIATRADGEVLVRARELGSGFPVAEVGHSPEAGAERRRGSLSRDLARGARLIATGSTTLLRASSYIAVAGGIGSLAYALYVVLIFAFQPEVQPGWTTMSLQLAAMMALFSLQFLLLAEHVIQIAANNPAGTRRHLIIREIRGALSRRSARLNVVDQEGRFQLGAPAPLTEQVGP